MYYVMYTYSCELTSIMYDLKANIDLSLFYIIFIIYIMYILYALVSQHKLSSFSLRKIQLFK